MRTITDMGANGICASGHREISEIAAAPKPSALTSPTTPTTVRIAASFWSPPAIFGRMRLPIGSSPGKACFANFWLTTTTAGASEALSCGSNSRPRNSGTPSVWK